MVMVTDKIKRGGEEKRSWKKNILSGFRYKFYIESEIKSKFSQMNL